MWLVACLCALAAQPAQAQIPLSPDDSYQRIVGELYPDETASFYEFYASLDVYDRYALARVIERLDEGEWGLFARLLVEPDRDTGLKTLRLFSGYDDSQLARVTGFLKGREFDLWKAIPNLVRAESYANARHLLLDDEDESACSIHVEGSAVDPDAPAVRYCSEAESRFILAFFGGGTGYVSRGEFAEEGEIPWQAQFSLYGPSTRAYYTPAERNKQINRFGRELKEWEINHTCGAVYLGGKFVLTAAHCIGTLADSRFFKGRRVHLGSIKIDGDRNLFEIKNVLVHADYKPRTLQNDIALIQLDRVPTGLRRLRSVGLPRGRARPSGQVPLLLSGWGYNRPATSSNAIFALDGQRQAPAQPSLLKGGVWVQNVSVCRNNRHFRRRGIDIYPGQLCVGSPGGVDSCRGDSGGPLVNARTEVLIGLVSGGAGCGLQGTPSIFTDVGYYRDWIDRAMGAAPGMRAKRKHLFR